MVKEPDSMQFAATFLMRRVASMVINANANESVGESVSAV